MTIGELANYATSQFTLTQKDAKTMIIAYDGMEEISNMPPRLNSEPFSKLTLDLGSFSLFSGTLDSANDAKKKFMIDRVIFNAPATVVLWKDGTKTVVKSGEKDEYDPEKGLAMCIAKKALGNKGNYYNAFKEWLPAESKEDSKQETNTDLLSSIRKVSETLRRYYENDSQ